MRKNLRCHTAEKQSLRTYHSAGSVPAGPSSLQPWRPSLPGSALVGKAAGSFQTLASAERSQVKVRHQLKGEETQSLILSTLFKRKEKLIPVGGQGKEKRKGISFPRNSLHYTFHRCCPTSQPANSSRALVKPVCIFIIRRSEHRSLHGSLSSFSTGMIRDYSRNFSF